MKILLIYLEDEKEKSQSLFSLLEKTKIPVEALLVKSPDESRRNIEKLFTAFFNKHVLGNGRFHPESPTHVVVFSPLPPGWIDFFAGFSCGSHVPFLVCGEEAVKCIPEAFDFCFRLFGAASDLETYLNAEYENYKKMELLKDTNAARDTLLKMGIPVNDESMARCVHEGSLQEVLFFLAAGFSPNIRSKAGVPLLNIAARSGNREIIRLLFAAGADIDVKADDRGTTGILDSVMGRYYEVVTDFIHAGANVNVQSKDGQTPLIVAVGAGDLKIVEALLHAGADPDISDNMGASARKYVALFHNSSMITLFETCAHKKSG
jgi:hypothetical protein